jgi:nicotinate-nucleotide--dimethylbenzimidazole phosphoribosyltransferase
MKLLNETISKIEKIDNALSAETQKRLDNLAKQIVEITKVRKPSLTRKVIFTLAGDHGVVANNVSAFPQEVTPQMVYNFLNGGAGINVLARHVGARVIVVDMGVACDLKSDAALVIKKVNYGTKNMTKGPAMSKDEAIKSVENGIEVFNEALSAGMDIVGTGDMGIGNTTPSSAIVAAITGRNAEEVTGRGTGIDDKALAGKIAAIEEALKVNKPDPKDGIDILAKVGGFEIGGLAGVMLAAAAHRIPVVIDGFISGAAALIAYTLEPKVRDYMIAAHCSVEKGHKAALAFLGLKPILDLNLRLGEGTGAVLGMNIIEAGTKILNEMATFESAGVSEKGE